MTAVVPVSADWLALREPADAAARSVELAEAAAARSARPAVVHDLGSGTGSMMRWLAPLLGPGQTWVLHDWNRMLLDRAAAVPPPEVVRVRSSVGDLAHLRPADLAGATLVTSSALLDVLAHDEIAAVVAACVAAGAPALFTLSVTGQVDLEPADRDDRALETAFNDHQRRAGPRRLLGPDAAPTAARLFSAAGWHVREARSTWRLDDSDDALLAEWLDGWVAAATEQEPAVAALADRFLGRRRAQLAAGTLRVDVHHSDLLAWPA